MDFFEQTMVEQFVAEVGAALCDRARKTAHNLLLALFYRRDGRLAAAVSGVNHNRARLAGALGAPSLPEGRA